MTHKPRQSLTFHTIFTCILAVSCLLVLFLRPSWLLSLSCALLVVYVTGNGIVLSRRGRLTRDTLLEYGIVASIVVLVIIGAVLH